MQFFADPSGLLAFSLLAAAIAAVPISRAVLGRYRRRVRELMRGGSDSVPERPAERRAPEVELELDRNPQAVPGSLSVLSGRSRPEVVYLAAGLAWAAAATALTFAFNELQPSPGRMVALGGVFLWPVLPPVARMAAWGRGAAVAAPLLALGGALVVGAALGGGVAAATLGAWAITMLPPTATFLLVSWLGVRTIGPWVAGFLSAWLLVVYSGLAGIASVGSAANEVVAVGLIVLLVAAALAGRATVRFVARLAVEKRVSDAMLSADVWWVVFTGWVCIWLSIPGETPRTQWLGVLAGLLPFVAYRGVVALGLRAVDVDRRGPRLLVLRVFGERGRSERLLASVGRRWRAVGSIQLIAAPDVAAATLDPDELLEFFAGRLDRAFIENAEALDSRLRDLDLEPDPDGSYRVTEFFCRRHSWRMTLQRLAGEAAAVLMDLRGFGPGNAGCIWELGQLLDLVPTERVVLIVDRETRWEFLDKVLRDEWSSLRADSPNLARAAGPIRVIEANERRADPATPVLAALAATLEAAAQ